MEYKHMYCICKNCLHDKGTLEKMECITCKHKLKYAKKLDLEKKLKDLTIEYE